MLTWIGNMIVDLLSVDGNNRLELGEQWMNNMEACFLANDNHLCVTNLLWSCVIDEQRNK